MGVAPESLTLLISSLCPLGSGLYPLRCSDYFVVVVVVTMLSLYYFFY